ncbi:glycosyltransferase [Paenibacillus sp. IB182496]|uniref:Glycosyltransferase n=2 Tax=Paenibacillus sabuli TaxID=2772509 RepID=A0A927BZ93_9BACL|nr:glycosyltransferase [Paenibacillus sabuli]
MREARERGRADGAAKGREDGYRAALHELAMRQLAVRQEPQPGEAPRRPLRLIYVTAGIDVPYPALDQAIIDGFTGLIDELHIARPSDDVAKLADEVRPDLVLVLNGGVLPADQVARMREAGHTTAVWFTDDPYYTDWTVEIAPRFDYVFTLEINCVPFYQEHGCANVHYMPFAADPAIFRPQRASSKYLTDICFIGTAFWNRVEMIDRLAPMLARRNVVISGWWWDRLRNYGKLADKIKLGDWMTPQETAQYYNGAKIVINLHRSIDDDTINVNSHKIAAHSANPRTFEIACSGAMQLSDMRPDLPSLYTPDEEIATYGSYEELAEKIEYYLTHEEERQRIATGGFTRTMRDHTYKSRLQSLLGIVFPELQVQQQASGG